MKPVYLDYQFEGHCGAFHYSGTITESEVQDVLHAFGEIDIDVKRVKVLATDGGRREAWVPDDPCPDTGLWKRELAKPPKVRKATVRMKEANKAKKK